MNVWMVSPAWRRYEVTDLVLAQRQQLVASLAARGLQAHTVVIANDENLDIARQRGCDVIEHPNRPVSRKFNAGLEYALAHGADWVVWVGSDDWVHEDVFSPLIGRELVKRPPIIIGRSLATVDLVTGRLTRLHAPGRYGAIPWLLPRHLLAGRTEQLLADRDRGLDGALVRGLRRRGAPLTFAVHDPHPLRLVDFKSLTNITSYARVTRHLATGAEEDAWTVLAERYPAELVELALAAHLQLKEKT